jgi:hypothetical protein
VRRVLMPLADVAERTGAVIVALMHLTKDRERQALYRILGSIGYVAAARGVLLVAKDPTAEARRFLVNIKNNLAPRAAPLTFVIDPLDEHRARLVWTTAPSDVDVESVVKRVVPERPEEPGAKEEAEAFLRAILADGAQWSADIRRAAEQNGIARRTLFRAKRELRIRAGKVGQPGTPDVAWYWYLPDAKDAPPTTPRPAPGARRDRKGANASKGARDPEGWHPSGNPSKEKTEYSDTSWKGAKPEEAWHPSAKGSGFAPFNGEPVPEHERGGPSDPDPAPKGGEGREGRGAAKVPLILTHQTVEDLRRLGYGEETINRLTTQEARDRLAQGEAAPAPPPPTRADEVHAPGQESAQPNARSSPISDVAGSVAVPSVPSDTSGPNLVFARLAQDLLRSPSFPFDHPGVNPHDPAVLEAMTLRFDLAAQGLRGTLTGRLSHVETLQYLTSTDRPANARLERLEAKLLLSACAGRLWRIEGGAV